MATGYGVSASCPICGQWTTLLMDDGVENLEHVCRPNKAAQWYRTNVAPELPVPPIVIRWKPDD